MSELLVFTVIFLMKGLFLDLWLRWGNCYRLCKNNPSPSPETPQKTLDKLFRCSKRTSGSPI
ncbi:hypothetical protein CRQ46_06345 [Salmonella enterica]|nr:hypothetical protein [Salmonella enterica]